MSTFPTCQVILDKRRIKKDWTYPVKLRVTYNRKNRFYKTKLSLTESDFKKAYESKKPRREYLKLRDVMLNIERKGDSILEDLSPFSFESFKESFEDKPKLGNDINAHYDRKIKELDLNSQISSRNNYKAARSKIMTILFNWIPGQKLPIVPFERISKSKLEKFEKEILKQGRSITTISIYLKSLRTLFNDAISAGLIAKSSYPFGRDKEKYRIKEVVNNKRGISAKQLESIANYNVIANPPLERAIDFWMLSFYLRGANIVDMLKLKNEDLTGEQLEFKRTKTIERTTKIKSVLVHITEHAQQIIDKYRTDSSDLGDYSWTLSPVAL